MVLKVVTGKILETLELAPGLTACGSVSESRKMEHARRISPSPQLVGIAVGEARSCADVRIVKDRLFQ